VRIVCTSYFVCVSPCYRSDENFIFDCNFVQDYAAAVRLVAHQYAAEDVL
jgi:hypothetical protein